MTLKEIDAFRVKAGELKNELSKERERLREESKIAVRSLLEGSPEGLKTELENQLEKFEKAEERMRKINLMQEILEALSAELEKLRNEKLNERRNIQGRIKWLKARIQEQEGVLRKLRNTHYSDRVQNAMKNEKIQIALEQLEELKQKLKEAEKELEAWDNENGLK